MSTTPPGWYPDAQGTTRWWDGTQWTEQTQLGQPDPYGQPGPVGQPGPYGQQGPGQFQYAQPTPGNKTNPAVLFGIGGGVLLIVVAIVAVLLLTGGDDEDPTPLAGTSENAGPVEVPSDPEGEEPDSGGGDEADLNAANAPRDASVEDFCASFDLQAINEFSDSPDLSELQAIQADMLAVGTPADMADDARRGWEWLVTLSGQEDYAEMNADDVSAVSDYYALNCM